MGAKKKIVNKKPKKELKVPEHIEKVQDLKQVQAKVNTKEFQAGLRHAKEMQRRQGPVLMVMRLTSKGPVIDVPCMKGSASPSGDGKISARFILPRRDIVDHRALAGITRKFNLDDDKKPISVEIVSFRGFFTRYELINRYIDYEGTRMWISEINQQGHHALIIECCLDDLVLKEGTTHGSNGLAIREGEIYPIAEYKEFLHQARIAGKAFSKYLMKKHQGQNIGTDVI